MIGEAPVEVLRAEARRGGPLGPLDAGPAALGAAEFATLSAASLTKRWGRTEER
jgi:hypothetical protein